MTTRIRTNRRWEVIVLKLLLGLYIILCFIIAGLNFGVAPDAPEKTAHLIRSIWHFYENYFKTFLIIIGSWLSLRILGKRSKMQRRNFAGFIIAALIVHIIGPIITSNHDLYFYAMPFPWTTTALQTAIPESSFYISHYPLWGVSGITASLIFYGIITAVVFIGTLFSGRRWQCSTLCLFNGFIAETFSQAFPLFGRAEQKRGQLARFLTYLKWPMVILSTSFFTFWLYTLVSGNYINSIAEILADIEVYKYLSAELLMMMFFWIIFTGRGYCHYCPLGTILGWLSRIAGQKIQTDKTKCISCGKCDSVCPMGIKIRSRAEERESVTDYNCLGCGH